MQTMETDAPCRAAVVGIANPALGSLAGTAQSHDVLAAAPTPATDLN